MKMQCSQMDVVIWLLTTSLLTVPIAASAQPKSQQVVKPPIAQYWMDVATNVTGIPGMPAMDEIPELPELPFGISLPGMAELKNRPIFGNTKAAPGRWVDIALFTQKKPGGTEATQAIPLGVKLGSSLPLLPTPQVPETTPAKGTPSFGDYERPKGRILLYWGCGETVRKGQPQVLDFSKKSPEELGKFMFGRGSADFGARNIPGHSIWPNDKDKRKLAKDASLVGEHTVSGEGVPAGLTFQLAQAQDFMPAIPLSQTGEVKESIKLNWQPVNNARSYFINAMGGGDDEMVIWTSSEVPETGFGLLDYLSSGDIDRWLSEKVLLPASTTQCAIPQGIFAKGQGGFVRMIAHGQELNIANPPRPTDVKKPWQPDWAARIRTKSTTMTFLGGDK